jgi:hypothetical protein
MAFEQATLKVVREREFGELTAAIGQVLSRELVVKFFKALDGRGIRVRNLEAVLAANLIDQVAGSKSGTGALYGALPVSDQAQVREFYLSKIEEVDPALRAKFHKLYQYS